MSDTLRILADIERRTRSVTLDEMGDEVVAYRDYELSIGCTDGKRYAGKLSMAEARSGYLLLDEGNATENYIPLAKISSIRVRWLQ